LKTSTKEDFMEYIKKNGKQNNSLHKHIDLFVQAAVSGVKTSVIVDFLLEKFPEVANGKTKKSFSGRVYAFARSKKVLAAIKKAAAENNQQNEGDK
jgi:hypothetical protein